MVLKDCIFCGVALTAPALQQPDSRTKEHIYAHWYRDNVVNNKIKMFTSDGTTATLHQQTALRDFVNRSVCGNCNNGWMSRLEEDVSPIFDKLTSGTDISQLNTTEVAILARWTGKTSIVLGYATPKPAIVPEFIRRTFLPSNLAGPHMRLFYAFVDADVTMEGGYLQMGYGEEIQVVGSQGPSGLRFTLCVYNHLLTVDFPPALAGIRYNLANSCSSQIWPILIPAGTAELELSPPVLFGDLLHRICSGIQVGFDIDTLHV